MTGRNGNRGTNKGASNDDPGDPQFVTMDTVTELLDQQKNFYEDLLKRQETSFRFSQLIMDSTSKRVDSVLSELQEIKVSLNYSQIDIDKLIDLVQQVIVRILSMVLATCSGASCLCIQAKMTGLSDASSSQPKSINIISNGYLPNRKNNFTQCVFCVFVIIRSVDQQGNNNKSLTSLSNRI